MNDDFVEIEQLISACIVHNQALNQCMLDDQNYFIANDFASMEQSDLKKADIQAQLNQFFQQLFNQAAITASSGDLFTKLSTYADTLDGPRQSKLGTLIQTLKEEYTSALRLIQMNRQVVHSNLDYIKDVISQLTQTPKKANCTTYDQTGALG